MTVEPTVRTSTLSHLAAELEAVPDVVQIRELPFLTQLNLRVDAEGPAAPALHEALGTPLPVTPNTSVRSGDLTVLWLGPDEWLVIAPDGSSEDLEKALRQALGIEPGAVVNLSAHRTTIELSGERAREILSKGCSLDLHPSVYTETSCAQTLLARAPVLLQARGGADPAYWLLVRASYATYVARWLIDASVEYSGERR